MLVWRSRSPGTTETRNTTVTALSFLAHFYFPASGQAVVTGVIPSPPRFLPLIFIAHRVQQSHCSSIVHRMLLTHALAFTASQFVHKKKSQRIYTRMHSAGLELTNLTYTRLEDNLIRHRGDRELYRILKDRNIRGLGTVERGNAGKRKVEQVVQVVR